MREVALLLVYSFVGAGALHNASHAPRLFDIDSVAVFAELEYPHPNGRLWSYATVPGLNLTVADVKAGRSKLGPENCQQLGRAISSEVQFYGLTDCGFTPGGSYEFYAYVEDEGSGEEGRLFVQPFTVAPDPWPLPFGPYCFDVDFEYTGSTVEGTVAGVADAEACQAICQASPGCLHFHYVYMPSLPDYRNCSQISAVRTVVGGEASPGIVSGPRSCRSRGVNSFRPRVILAYTEPSPATRAVPFALLAKGVNFEPDYDRIMLVPPEQPCSSLNADGSYLVNGTRPSTISEWARLPCNGTASIAHDVSVLVCGQPPETVLFSDVGPVKICLCDAGRTPYGCDHEGGHVGHFHEDALKKLIDIAGPYPNQTRYCPSNRPCRVTNLQGYRLREGDRLMIRESCSTQARPAVRAYTEASRPAPLAYGLLFAWEEQSTVTCPPGVLLSPCAVGRICYCPRSHGCTHDGDFLTDAGQMIFFQQSLAPDGLRILQEDYQSFTIFWNYPASDGGGVVDSYTLYFKTCTGGGFEDGTVTAIPVPSEPGDNHQGKARNGTYQFREVPYSYYSADVQPATRYCVRISATNAAGESVQSPELVWVTDVHPPTDLHYPNPPLFLVQGVAMANLMPVVTTQDCRDLPSVVSSDPQVRAEDCHVQLYEVSPDLPRGLSLDPLSGNISGTPLDVSPRPQIYRVTATNAGGKSSFHLSLSVVDRLDAERVEESQRPTVAMCLSSYGVNDAIVTFRTPEVGRWQEGCEGNPQNLRLTVLDPAVTRIFQTSGVDLGENVARDEAVPCGQLVLDTWSSSSFGFPPPGLCFWNSNGDSEAWAEVIFQGGRAFEAGAWYQLVLKLRIAPRTPAGRELLRLDLLCAEASSEENSASSRHLGAWTPALSLPRWRPELDLVPPTPLATPVADAPWVTGRPLYVPGFGNPLAGEAPKGQLWPWGFPAPGPTTCYNATSRCPTSPHQFVNAPGDTAWYTDVDFPSFRVLTGVATLLTPILMTMRFSPFATFNATALSRPEAAAGSQQALYVDQQEFSVDFSLSLDSLGRIILERDLTICPSSPLQWPMLQQQPYCRISVGPIYVQCRCESTLPPEHEAARCDRVVLSVSERLEVRSQVTATLRVLSGSQPSFAGILPIKWYGQVKSRYGGLDAFHKTEGAGLDVWPDLVLSQTTPEACAEECLKRLPITGVPVPCRSFNFHRPDSDCYLSQHVETEFIALRTDWRGNPYDNYEYQEQVVYTVMTPQHLSASGLFFSDVSIEADSFLDPPLPSPPPFGVSHFFPSYAGQPHIAFSLELVPVAPIYGQDPWRSKVLMRAPAGLRPVGLRAWPGVAPTPQGLGYCGGAGASPSCSWFLSWGQTLWPPARYRFELTIHNPEDPSLAGQLWHIQVQNAGFSTEGPVPAFLPLAAPHPLPVEGRLEACSAHFAAARPVLPTGRLAESLEQVLDLFFVLPRSWPSSTVLQVLLPESFALPSSCRARPLTPWLRAERLGCDISRSRGVRVRFEGPLLAQAAVGLRLLPFSLPSDYASVHPGENFWPLLAQDAVQPKSLNVRLQVIRPPQDSEGAPVPGDACHPAVWSCGLEDLAWAARRLDLRPSRQSFESLVVHSGHAEPFRARGAWAAVEFAVNSSLAFGGALDELLFLSPPYGYVITGLHSADVQVLSRDLLSGQLNLPTVLHLVDAMNAAKEDFILDRGGEAERSGGSVLRVRRLHGAFHPGQLYLVNLSIQFPASGAEPSLLDPAVREPGRSGCAHAWGLALEAAGQRLVAGFTEAEPLAFLAQFEVDCTSRAAGAENLLTFHFATTQRALPSLLPEGAGLLLLLSLPGHFELAEPAVDADFAAPFQYNRSRDAPIYGSARPEAPAFRKLGCPQLLARSRGRLLPAGLRECSVHFDDAQGVLALALVVDRLAAAASHELLLRASNAATSTGGGDEPNSVFFGLSIFQMHPGQAFWQVPAPLELDGSRSLLRLQAPLRAVACGPPLPSMQAAVEHSLCLLDGRRTEVTLSFLVPAVLAQPVSAVVTAPVGYSIPWTCNSSVSSLSLPHLKRFDAILESMMVDCVVTPDGRTASFTILKDLKAKIVWHYFTIHATNPRAEDAPSTAEQHSWSLVVGGFAAGSASAAGVPAPPLRVLTDLDLRELPFTYNQTSWALALRFRTSALLQPGGRMLLRAPAPFAATVEQCRAEGAAVEAVGSSLFVPALPASPFQPVPEPGSSGLQEPEPGRVPGLPLRAECQVPGPRQLEVILLDGHLPPGLYEFRFAIAVDEESAQLLRQADVQEGPLAPMRWNVETWQPASSSSCSGDCCAERRPVDSSLAEGPQELELAERGLLEAYPSGAFLHRRLVPDSYGGWRFGAGGA